VPALRYCGPRRNLQADYAKYMPYLQWVIEYQNDTLLRQDKGCLNIFGCPKYETI
jgi:hypothetical protein